MPATCGNRQFAGGLALWAATAPKSDRSSTENEDAAAWCVGSRRFAICDGATDAAFSGPWAAALAREFVASGPSLKRGDVLASLPLWMAPLQQAWRDGIPRHGLPWYLEEKTEMGAYSTLLALQIDPAPTPQDARLADAASLGTTLVWHALAVGDSCLFHWRKGGLLSAFPLSDSTAFSQRPFLIASRPERNLELPNRSHRTGGICRPGDHFLLATDAIAQWLLREWESGAWRAGDLVSADNETSFISLISHLRASKGLRDDDTTLLHIEVGATPNPADQGLVSLPPQPHPVGPTPATAAP